MNREKSCGAVVFTSGEDGVVRYVLVRQRSGKYCFPKGHVEAGETEHQTALREIWEETGLHPAIISGFRETETYEVAKKPGTMKDVIYFLAEYSGQPLDPPVSDEIREVRLCSYREAMALLPTDSRKEILTKADHLLSGERTSAMIEIKQIMPDSKDAEIVSGINDEAFPPSEHIDLKDMFRMNESLGAGVFGLYDAEKLVGFTWGVGNSRCVYIFFLAIDAQHRGRGYGTQAIDALFRFYSEKQVILDFEELDPAAENYAQRVRRKNFYLHCGFHETGRFTIMNDERFEVVCNGGSLDEEGFRDIIRRIHEMIPFYQDVLL